MNMLNQWLNRHIPWLTPAVLVIGILLHQQMATFQFLIPGLFVIITFLSSLHVRLADIRHAVTHPLPLLVALTVINLIMPVLALITATLMFPDHEAYLLGTVFAFLIPTAVVSVIWVTINRGNVALVLFIILINTLLVPLYLPGFLYLFLDISVTISYADLAGGLFLMLVIPSIMGVLTGHFWRGHVSARVNGIQLGTKMAFFAIIMINGSLVAPFIYDFDRQLALVIMSVLGLSIIAYGIGYLGGQLTRLGEADFTAVFFSSGMRNIGAGSGLAAIFFPPAVVLPVIVGTLFQQILAAQMSRVLQKRKQPGQTVNKPVQQDD
ncbi:bile acid:sodium symporter family protein [Salisediminibacterium beveridgei]|uniref:Bile acid sodium symporter n=1 Tax=Salisediminibacterium beveridgei TaxID=632773 RepID=A0A1D7QSA1_9BACI|nr:bile acid:sodium symporter family protein [Salisediminibacterium beveridgei]AOM81861.1 Bile acid sodium symporter [Salisediminibacterium beveridgei]